MIATELPGAVAEVYQAGYRAPTTGWIVDSLIAKDEVTAFAAAEGNHRYLLGANIIRGLLARHDTAILGRPVNRRCDSVLVLASSVTTAHRYRAILLNDSRLEVARLTTYRSGDVEYFSGLQEWIRAQSPDAVVLDCLQDFGNGADASLLGRFASICPTLVALLRGNETKPGAAGGTAHWDSAAQRFWLDPKSFTVHPIEARTLAAPWTVDLATDDPGF